MKVRGAVVLWGPSRFSLKPAIRYIIQSGPGADADVRDTKAAILDTLSQGIPNLRECLPQARHPEPLGEWLASVLMHAATELQRAAGDDVEAAGVLAADTQGVYQCAYGYEDAQVGLAAGQLIASWLEAWAVVDQPPGGQPDLITGRNNFLAFARSRQANVDTRALIAAARLRDIPARHLGGDLLLLGQGRYQRRMFRKFSDRTTYLAYLLSRDKSLANPLLRSAGLPVPKQIAAQTADQAVEAAEQIGFPVVVKPRDTDHGRGVSVRVGDGDGVRAAFDQVQRHAREAVIERFAEGRDYRLLVVDGEMIAAAERIPAHVTGDGVQTIAELVKETNRDPRRDRWKGNVLTRIEIDDEVVKVLAARDRTPASIPRPGERVFLRSLGNLSMGGTSIDVTDVVHADNRELVVEAARTVGIDIAGVDLLSSDISASHKRNGTVICEINVSPGLRVHYAPDQGEPRDVAGAIIETIYPRGAPARIPIAAITGTNGKTTTCCMVSHILALAGFKVGLATTEGLFVDGERTQRGDMSGPRPASKILHHPKVDAAVLETARGATIRWGLGFESCSVAAVLNVTADHLGFDGVHSIEEMAEVKSLVTKVARDMAVLNADDPLCRAMAGCTQAERVCWVSFEPSCDLVRTHIETGHPAVVAKPGDNGEIITLYDEGKAHHVIDATGIPATLDGQARHNIGNAMFATAVAYGLAQDVAHIGEALSTFECSFEKNPGRMNVFRGRSFTAILDFCHNPGAFEAMSATVRLLPVRGRRLCVLCASGNRLDEDYAQAGRAAAGSFDHYVCHDSDDLRGRAPGEVASMLRKGLMANGVPGSDITVIGDEAKAVRAGLDMARDGDLLMVIGYSLDRCWEQITTYQRAD